MEPSSLSTLKHDNGEKTLALAHGLTSTEHEDLSTSGSSTSKYEAKIETYTKAVNGRQSDEACSVAVEVNLRVQNEMKNSYSCHGKGNYNPGVWKVKISSESCLSSREGTLDVQAPQMTPKASSLSTEKVSRYSPLCPVNVDDCLYVWKPKQNLVSTSPVSYPDDKVCAIANGNPKDTKSFNSNIKGPAGLVNVEDCLKVWKPKKNIVSMSRDSKDENMFTADGSPEDIKSLKSDRKEFPPCQRSVKQSSIGLSGKLLSAEQERTSASIKLNEQVKRRTNSEYLNSDCLNDSYPLNMDRIIKPLDVVNKDGSVKVCKWHSNPESGISCDEDEYTKVWKQNMNFKSSIANVDDNHKVWKPKDLNLSTSPSSRVMGSKSSTVSGIGRVKALESESPALQESVKSSDEGFSTKMERNFAGRTNISKEERKGNACNNLSNRDDDKSYAKDVNLQGGWLPEKPWSLDCNKSSISGRTPQGIKPLSGNALLPCNISACQSSLHLSDEDLSVMKVGKLASRTSMSDAEAKSETYFGSSNNNSSDEKFAVNRGGNLKVWRVKRTSESSNVLDEELSAEQVKNCASSTHLSKAEIKSESHSEFAYKSFADKGENLETWRVKRSPEFSLILLNEESSAKQVRKSAISASMLNDEVNSETNSDSSSNNSSDKGRYLKVWRVKRNSKSSILSDEKLSAKEMRTSSSTASMLNAEFKSGIYSVSSNNNSLDESCFSNRSENFEVWRVKRNPVSSNLLGEEFSAKQVMKSVSRASMSNDEMKREMYAESSNNNSSDEPCFVDMSEIFEACQGEKTPKTCLENGDVSLQVWIAGGNGDSYHSSVHDIPKVWKQTKNPTSGVSIQSVCGKSTSSSGSDHEPLLVSGNSSLISQQNYAKQSSEVLYHTSSGRTHSLKAKVKSFSGGGGLRESSNAEGHKELAVGNVNSNDKQGLMRASRNLKSCLINMNGNSNVRKPTTSPVSVSSVSNAVSNPLVSTGTMEAVKTSKSQMNTTLPCQVHIVQCSAEVEASNHKKLEDFLFDMLGYGFKFDRTVIQEVLGYCGYDMKQSISKLLDLAAETLRPKQRFNQGKQTATVGQNRNQKINNCHGTRFETMYGLKDSGQREDRYEQEEITTTLLGSPDRTKDIEQYIRSTCIAQDDMEVDEIYSIHRKAVAEYRSLVKDYYQAAAEAFAKDNHALAITLLEKGQFFYRKAREADEESAERTFQMSGNDEDNQEGMTLDLQNLKVKEAIRAVKCHLRALCGVGTLRITNGNEADSLRESRMRKVMMFLDYESIKWLEEDGDPWTILVRLDEISPNQLSFV